MTSLTYSWCRGEVRGLILAYDPDPFGLGTLERLQRLDLERGLNHQLAVDKHVLHGLYQREQSFRYHLVNYGTR